MAAFWGFLTALICAAMFVGGFVLGYVCHEHSESKPVPRYRYAAPSYSGYYANVNHEIKSKVEPKKTGCVLITEEDWANENPSFFTEFWTYDPVTMQLYDHTNEPKNPEDVFFDFGMAELVMDRDSYANGPLHIVDYDHKRLYLVTLKGSVYASTSKGE